MQTRLVAVLMALPALAGTLGLSAIETRRLILLALSPPAAPSSDSLADALEKRDVERAYAILRAGHDPNEPVAFRHPVLTEGETIMATPLLLAVAQRDTDMVMMLLSLGSGHDRLRSRFAACLADTLGDADTARMIREAAMERPEECPAPEPGRPLLESFSIFAESAGSG